jgi:hypothetical protein
VTGARPGEFAYSRGYREHGHYLKVEVSVFFFFIQYHHIFYTDSTLFLQDLEFKWIGKDAAGPIFTMTVTVSWIKGKRFCGHVYVFF